MFAYIGANYDVESVATSISITNSISFEASDCGVKKMSKRMNACIDNWFAHIGKNLSSLESDNSSFFDDF